MRVYRLEHPGFKHPVSGHPLGPYCTRNTAGPAVEEFSNRLTNAHNDDEHPVPEWCNIVTGQVFGFAELDQLEDWFAGWLEEAQSLGFEVVAYEVGHVIDMGEQVSFWPHAALKCDMVSA